MTSRAQTARKSAENLTEKIAPYAASARESAAHAAEHARTLAAPKIEHAKEWTAPRVDTVKEKVGDDLVPKVAAAVTAALAAAEPVREEAKTRGTAALAALRGELEPPKPKRKRGVVRKFFLLAALGGAAAAAWKAWQAKSAGPSEWSSTSYSSGTPATSGLTTVEPTTPPAAASASAEAYAGAGTPHPTTDDVAAASPDEALADAAASEEVVAAPGESDVPSEPGTGEREDLR